MSVTIMIGDVFEKLAELPDDHFDCVVTSPPYWGLRDYQTATWEGGDPGCDHRSPTMRAGRDEQRATLAGSPATNSAQLLLAHRSSCGKCGAVKVDRQLGLEPTLSEHLDVMVAVFREVRRVLKPTGTLWLNYGDCYAKSPNGRSAADTKATGNDNRTFRDKPFSTVGPIRGGPPSDKSTLRGNGHVGGGPKLKTLTPTRLRAGRSQNLGNVAGDGVRRNPTGGVLKHKDLCMVPQRLAIALQEDGWWIRSMLPWVKRNGMPESISDRPANSLEYVIFATKARRYFYDVEAVKRPASQSTNARVAQNVAAQAGSIRANGGRKTNGPMKAVVRRSGVTPKSASEDTNIRSKGSWHASTAAVVNDRNFRNTDLFFDSLEPPFGLISDADGTPLAIDANPQGYSEAHFATFPPSLILPLLKAGCPPGGRVLDPFGGSGTTGLVADKLGFDCTLIDLNPAYGQMARHRIGLFAEVA